MMLNTWNAVFDLNSDAELLFKYSESYESEIIAKQINNLVELNFCMFTKVFVE